MINEVAQAIALTSMVVVIVFVFVLMNRGVEKKIRRLFLIGLFMICILVVVDAIEVATKSRETYSSLRMASTVIGYCIRPMLAFIVEIVMMGEHKHKTYVVLALPGIFNILVMFSAFFSDIAFTYTETNKFVRGPLGYTPFVVAFFYLIVLGVIGYQKMKLGNRNEGYVAGFIGIMTLLSTFLEWRFQLVGIISGACCVSIMCYYLYYYITFQDKDVLTGAYLRRRLMIDASNNMDSLEALLAIDLNDLKLLNDQRGHSVGDAALKTLIQEVKHLKPQSWEVYRVGGDEFSILCYKTNCDEIDVFIQKLQEAMNQKGFSVACGYAMVNEGDSLTSISERADGAMYANKALLKGDLKNQKYRMK